MQNLPGGDALGTFNGDAQALGTVAIRRASSRSVAACRLAQPFSWRHDPSIHPVKMFPSVVSLRCSERN